MTAAELKGYSVKDLANLARRRGVNGWQRMKKEQLIQALLRGVRSKVSVATAKASAKAAASKSTKGSAERSSAEKRPANKVGAPNKSAPNKSAPNKSTANKIAANKIAANKSEAPSKNGSAGKHPIASKNGSPKTVHSGKKAPPAPKAPVAVKGRSTASQRRLSAVITKQAQRKNLGSMSPNGTPANVTQERLLVMVRDPFWLHAYWELSHRGVERARAALGSDWHAAKPVLRVLEVSSDGSTNSESVVRNIEVHGGVNNWYVHVEEPPKSYRMEVGYLAMSGKFFPLARSNVVTTPSPGTTDEIDGNWSDLTEKFEKIYAMSGGSSPNGASPELQALFEERLRRPIGSPLVAGHIPGMNGNGRGRSDFHFELDAELIIYGSTESTARVTLRGEPMQLRPDGTFTVRMALPDCRQVIPAVSQSADGLEQRTIVLAIERNTKTMEPVVHDNND